MQQIQNILLSFIPSLLQLLFFFFAHLLIDYNNTLEIRNSLGVGGLSIPNATMQSVQSTADVLNLMRLGEKNRAFSSTAMNHRSSRSHRYPRIYSPRMLIARSIVNFLDFNEDIMNFHF